MLISYKKLTKFTLSCLFAAMLTISSCSAISGTSGDIQLLEGGVNITNNTRRVSMSLRDSDTRQVLRMLADKAGMNIIMHDSVSGNVTLDLVNVTLNKAFEYVMVMNNLAYWVDGNTLIVASKEASKDLAFAQQRIRTFDVKYENAGRIADFLNKNIFKLKNPGLSNDEVAMSNPNTNQIMIVGTERDFQMAAKVIAQLDKKSETVMFKVNHIAPGKMAGIICHKVFKSDEIKDEDQDAEGKGGAKIACTAKDIEGSEVDGTYSSFKSTGLAVTYYPDLGTIGIAGATVPQLQMIDEIISQNDIKQKQAVLEVAILELSANGIRDISPTWQVGAGTFGLAFNPEQGTLSVTTNAPVGTPGFQMAFDLTMKLQQGKARVLSNPKILVRNNTESTFDVTQEYISNISTQVTSAYGSQAIQGQTVEKDTYGIKMKIKPTITPDNYIYMDISPDYSIPNGTYSANDNPGTKQIMELIAERKMELKGIRVKDNETLVIGGLIQEREERTLNKIPILGDLPLVGVAFRSSSKTLEKTELMLIITPKILNDDEPVNERM